MTGIRVSYTVIIYHRLAFFKAEHLPLYDMNLKRITKTHPLSCHVVCFRLKLNRLVPFFPESKLQSRYRLTSLKDTCQSFLELVEQ